MTKQVRWYLAGATATILVIVAVLLGSHSPNKTMNMSATSMSGSAVSTDKVGIQNYMFAPMTIKVKVGTTVTWTNQDPVHHSVTADTISKDAPNGPLIGQGQSYSFKFTKAGTYTFHCMPHPYMHGTVIVTS